MNFITNWFVANPERGQECLERLNSGDYQAAKELTQSCTVVYFSKREIHKASSAVP